MVAAQPRAAAVEMVNYWVHLGVEPTCKDQMWQKGHHTKETAEPTEEGREERLQRLFQSLSLEWH